MMSATDITIRTPGLSTHLFYPKSCFLKKHRQYTLDANVLDIVLMKESGFMLVSLDNVHSPLSTKEPASQKVPPIIRAFDLRTDRVNGESQHEWIKHDPHSSADEDVQHGSFDDMASKLNQTLRSEYIRHEVEFETAVKPKALYSTLGEFLYGWENLRKKSQGDGEEQRAEELAATNPEEK